MKMAKDELKELATIDLKKAVDSVSHDYLIKLLTFFNVRPYMIKIFKAMMNFKIAGIQTTNSFSDIFLILVGVAQGGSPSGLIFLLALKPLLWKIKFSNNIEKNNFADNNSLSNASLTNDVTLLLH